MLAEAENGLIAHIKTAALGQRLRQVDSLPDLDADSLVKKFATDAPAVYVSAAPFQVSDGSARLKFGIACVARNSRGFDAARKGDGKVIGLYDIMESVASLVDGASIADLSWRVTGGDFLSNEALYKAGVYAGVVQVEMVGASPLPSALDESALADFQTFHGDYDVDPHQAPAEHDKWLQEPPDHSTSAPELSDTIILQE